MTSRPSSDQTWQPIDGRVALIAPASAIATDVLEATLRQLEVHGVDYHLGRHVEARYRYLAGTVEQRLEDLHNAFDMPDITAVWCLRGGYGCGQLLPGLDWGRLQAASPRPLIGFSDISVLLSAFHRHGLPAIHGPVATGLGLSPLSAPREQQERLASQASVSRLLAGIDHELPVQHLGGHKQRVEGALIGGNLTALACMAGTLGGLHAPRGRSWSWRTSANPTTAWSAASGNCSKASTRASSARSAWARSPIARARKSPTAWSGSSANTPPPSRCRSTTTYPAGMVRRTEPGLTGRPQCSRETGCAGRDGARHSPYAREGGGECRWNGANPSGIRPRRAAAATPAAGRPALPGRRHRGCAVRRCRRAGRRCA
ncbi:LD-carboxypeptidase [Pseudomonas aeruginosa]|nr:LD-carboxypeptidase [Pseudomonas aeruginosa]